MAAINMPIPSGPGDTYLAPNGVNYIWDGVKWTVAEDASSGVNLWARNPIDQELQPIYPGDSVFVADETNVEKIRLDADGTVSALNYDIESLSELP